MSTLNHHTSCDHCGEEFSVATPRVGDEIVCPNCDELVSIITGATWVLVQADGLGKCTIRGTVQASTYEEAEQELGPIPESEVYVAGHQAGSEVCRSTDWYIDGPFASILEAHERIEG